MINSLAITAGLGAALLAWPGFSLAPLAAPRAGEVIINEYGADNDANGNDFFELLVVGDAVDLRGLRVSDNELVNGSLNNGESVFTFDNVPYLSAVPRGTLIAVWTAKGVATDTVVNPAAGDWKLVLGPGTGITVGDDRLGGDTNPGLADGGDALYVYLPGPNGNSTGNDNVYLDFVSWENDAAAPPAGMADLNLSANADNAYYTGATAAGNDAVANWTRYDAGDGKPTPGDPNPQQNLATLRRR